MALMLAHARIWSSGGCHEFHASPGVTGFVAIAPALTPTKPRNYDCLGPVPWGTIKTLVLCHQGTMQRTGTPSRSPKVEEALTVHGQSRGCGHLDSQSHVCAQACLHNNKTRDPGVHAQAQREGMAAHERFDNLFMIYLFARLRHEIATDEAACMDES
jgi:hypothetical protein